MDLLTRVEALEAAVVAVFKNQGNPDALRKWYDEGAGGKVDWGHDGDFMQCVDKASNYMTDEEAKGFCANRHHSATGHWPGEKKAHG